MFTGLIEEIGRINQISHADQGRSLTIQAPVICQDMHVDDSIAVDGVCLTVTHVHESFFTGMAVRETLERSTLSRLETNHRVNLERALKPSDRMGGHWVQGHVDGVGAIRSVQKQGVGMLLAVDLPEGLMHYCVEKGSIALQGVSLTIASVQTSGISISVIPHTCQHTTLQYAGAGTKVNIEVDILAKYMERMMQKYSGGPSRDESWYRSHGYS